MLVWSRINDEFVAQIPKRGLGDRVSEHVASVEYRVSEHVASLEYLV